MGRCTSRCGTPAVSRIRPLPRCASTRATCTSAGSKTTASAGFRCPTPIRPGPGGTPTGRAASRTTRSNNQCLRGQTVSLARDIVDRIFFPNRDVHSIPVLDGGFSPNERLDRARQLGDVFDSPDALVLDGEDTLYVSAGQTVYA